MEKLSRRIARALLTLLLLGGAASLPLLVLHSCKPEPSGTETPGTDSGDDPGTDPGTDPGDDPGTNPGTDPHPGFVEEADDPAADPSRTFDYSILAKAGHPRLLMGEEDFATLKKKVTSERFSNPTLYKIHSLIVAHAGDIVSADEELTDPASHEKVVEHLLYLAYAWRLTAKPTFLAKLRTDLRKVSSWGNWNSSSALSFGEISQAVAIAYDWAYYDLSLEERVNAHKAMVRNGIRPSTDNGYRQCIGNWNQVANSGVMSASLAIYEKDKALAVNNIEAGLEDNKHAMGIVYAGGGGYPEGSNYWEYGTGNEVILLQSLERIFGSTGGLREVSGFMDSGGFAVFTHGTRDTSFSFNDGGNTYDNPLLASWWFAARKDDPSLAYGEKHLLDNGKYASSLPRRLPLVPCYIYDYGMDSKGITPPAATMWHCGGQIPVGMIRHGWNYDASDVYLCVKGGHADTWASMNTSHGHMDAGSFVFEAEGQRWSDDIMRPSYSAWFAALQAAGSRSGDTSQKGLRWDTFRVNNLCHSTISAYANDGSVANKLHPSDQWVSGQANIVATEDTPSRQSFTLDLSAPMKGQVKSARRTIALVGGKDLEITDEIEALPGLDCPLEWRMLSVSNCSVSSGKVVFKALADASITRELTVSSSLSDVKPVYKSWSTVRPSSWTSRSWDPSISNRVIAGWSVTLPAGKKATFTTTLKKP